MRVSNDKQHNYLSDLSIMDMWANYTCIILAEEDSKENRNVQNKEDINPISDYYIDCSLNNSAVYRCWLSLAYYIYHICICMYIKERKKWTYLSSQGNITFLEFK